MIYLSIIGNLVFQISKHTSLPSLHTLLLLYINVSQFPTEAKVQLHVLKPVYRTTPLPPFKVTYFNSTSTKTCRSKFQLLYIYYGTLQIFSPQVFRFHKSSQGSRNNHGEAWRRGPKLPRGEKSGIGTTSPMLHPALSCRPGSRMTSSLGLRSFTHLVSLF